MCFYSKLSKKAVALENRFKAHMKQGELFIPSDQINGFSFPKTPVITDKEPQVIQLFSWGLIPFWSKDKSIQKNTLNARIETLKEKPSFRFCEQNRCLIIADGFYEWQWLDEAGKKKQKYCITIPEQALFAFAGLYSEWTDKETGEVIPSYCIVTTEAKGIMETIHNSKHRMPVILDEETEKLWLSGEDSLSFKDCMPKLIALAV